MGYKYRKTHFRCSPRIHEAQLSQRDHAILRVIAYFAKSLNVHQGHLPPTKEEVYVFARTPELVCLFVCLCARLLKNACVDLDEMLRVDRCRDMDELINF